MAYKFAMIFPGVNQRMGRKKSFTLVELVVVVAVIALLMAITLPAYNALKLAAKKTKDVSNLKKIAEAWKECVVNRGWRIDGTGFGMAYSVATFASKLAGFGRTNISDIILNDPYVYISPGDGYASTIQSESFCKFSSGQITWTNPFPFKDKSNFMVASAKKFISYCFVLGLPKHVPLDRTPLGFTRGLNEKGLWDERAGLYGSRGGYVVFCDGRVTWFDGSKPVKFLKWDGTGYTSNIREAVPGTRSIEEVTERTSTGQTITNSDRIWITCTSDLGAPSEEYKSNSSSNGSGAHEKEALAIIITDGAGGDAGS